jgi:hypothetical protein
VEALEEENEAEDCSNTKTWCEEPKIDLMGKLRKQK